jgi:hypothetical protein
MLDRLTVQRRITALAITDLLRHLVDQLNHIRPCALMGLGWRLDGAQVSAADISTTFRY